MIYRTSFAMLGLAAIVLSSSAQESPTVPVTRSVSKVFPPAQPSVAPTPATIGAEKLTAAREMARALASGQAKVIVTLSPPPALAKTDLASRASLAALRPPMKKLQQDVLDQLPANHVKVGHRFDNIAGFSANVSADGLKALQAHPQVISIEPVFVLRPHLAQGIPLMHGMTHRSTYNGAGLAIAVCDSGIDYNHPRLGGGGFPNSKVLGGYDFGSDDADPIPNGEAHGTACAGIAAGDLGTVGDYIGGVAYNAKLYALKITSGTGGTATTADMVAAWDWCVTHKDDHPSYPIMVISTSFGGGQYFATCDSATPSMTAAANNAVAAGITVLASSGNEGYCDSIAWPSCITSVISVGAVYDASFGHYSPCIEGDSCAPKISTTGCATRWYADDTTAADKVTSYANVASFLTLFAPGNQCYTLDIAGSTGDSSGDYFGGFGGTSAACPYAAGAVACLQSAAKALTGNYLSPQQVRSRLTSLGDNVTDTKVAITKPRVNLERVIEGFGTNPVLNFVSATLLGGNGDQSVVPNECHELRIAVRNDGLSTATNISATLRASTPGLSIVQQTSAYPDLAAGATGTNATIFRTSTSPSFVCGTPVNVMLVLAYDGGTNTNSFTLVSGSTNYVITQSSGASMVRGTTDIGNHGDGTTTTIALPFAYTFYGQTFSSATVSSDGHLQFTGTANISANSCLPVSGFTDSIFAFWDNLRTDGTIGPAQGIYTSTSGVSPTRVFNIEWRASYYHPGRKGDPVNFEVRLHESLSRFDLIYETLNGNGSSATVGAQKTLAGPFTQFECNSGGLSTGLQLAFQTICADGGGACGTPVADFAGSPTNGTAPLAVSFTNLSSGATRYGWDFGNGQTSTAANPSSTYTNAGGYHVKLTAMNAAGTNTLTRTNYIVVSNPPPVANFAANVTNGAVPLAVTFTNLSSGATSYSWDFGDGKTSSATDAANTYISAGGYTVKLTAVGAGGTSTLTRASYILATNTPPAIVGQPQDRTVIAGADATFSVTATGTSPLSYQWQFQGTDIPGATTASFTRTNAQCADAGGYTVIVTNAVGSTMSSVANLTVIAAPFIAAQPTNQIILQGQDATFAVAATNQCGGELTYQWRFDEANIAGATAGSFVRMNASFADAGSYSVIVSNFSGSVTSAVASLMVIPPPPAVDFTANPTSGLAPLTVYFTNLSSGATDYSWTFGDGTTSSNENPTTIYTRAGSYTVTLTAFGTGGTNSLTRTNYLVVIDPPRLVVTPASLDFGLIATGATVQGALVVSNAGAFTLEGTAAIADGPFTIVSGTAFSLGQSGVTNLVIDFSPTIAGVFSNVVVFASTGGVSTNTIVGRTAGAPLIVLRTLSGSEFAFSFDTVPGPAYTVQYKASLDDPAWQTLQSVAGDGTRKTVTNSIAAPSQRFYRLQVQ